MREIGGQQALLALGTDVAQIGFVVKDLDRTLETHRAMGPWRIYTHDAARVPGMHIGGIPASFKFRLAINSAVPQIEFIEPVEGPNPYQEWLDEKGEGIHHLGFHIPDAAATTSVMETLGVRVIMGGTGYGRDGSGAYCYYDTVDLLGYISEAIELPRKRWDPDAVILP